MKKIILILILGFNFLANIVCQGTPVIDIAHILETIRNGAQVYQQVQTGIQQMQYQYQSMKAQLKALQQLDPSKIQSFSDAVSMVDKNLTFLRNTENNIKNMRIKVGENNYSLFDLYKAPGGVFSQMTDLWTREMSDAEKARAWSYYGLDPRNYNYVQTWKGRINEGAQKLASMSFQMDAMVEENAKFNDELLQESMNSDSTITQMQIMNAYMAGVRGDLSMLNSIMASLGNMIGDKFVSEIQMNNTTYITDDFFMKSTTKLKPLEGIY